MKENNLLAELAAYLFSCSNTRDGPHAVGARAGRAFFRQPRPDPRGAGHPRGHAHRRAAGQVGHLPDDQAGRASRRWRCLPRPACRSTRSRSTRRSSCARSTRSRRPSSPAARATDENFERLREILQSSEERSRGRRAARRGGPRLPSGDRARHPEQRLPPDLQRLLHDGRARGCRSISPTPSAAASRMPSTCRSSTRCCAATATWRRR